MVRGEKGVGKRNSENAPSSMALLLMDGGEETKGRKQIKMQPALC